MKHIATQSTPSDARKKQSCLNASILAMALSFGSLNLYAQSQSLSISPDVVVDIDKFGAINSISAFGAYIVAGEYSGGWLIGNVLKGSPETALYQHWGWIQDNQAETTIQEEEIQATGTIEPRPDQGVVGGCSFEIVYKKEGANTLSISAETTYTSDGTWIQPFMYRINIPLDAIAGGTIELEGMEHGASTFDVVDSEVELQKFQEAKTLTISAGECTMVVTANPDSILVVDDSRRWNEQSIVVSIKSIRPWQKAYSFSTGDTDAFGATLTFNK